MTYTRVNWQDGSGGGTPMDAANLNVMDAGIAANDTAINGSQTPSESATPAASGSVATLLSYIASQLKLITGGAHWYSAPAATLASLLSSVNSLSSGKVNKSGDTMSGPLTVSTPPVLAAGNQESGFCGLYNGAPTSGQFYGAPVNFKTQLSNNPSSITLNMNLRNSGSSNTFVDVWNTYGFRIVARAASTAVIDVAGIYVTVGNCLLAVDTQAQTFDHHCTICNAVHKAQPLSALDVHDSRTGYSGLALAYVCPECGSPESFDTRMTAADEQDTTPQGEGVYATTRGAQARLIRQLLTLLELPVA